MSILTDQDVFGGDPVYPLVNREYCRVCRWVLKQLAKEGGLSGGLIVSWN